MATLSDMEQLLRALADSNRLRILAVLRSGELCVCQMMAVLGLSQSTVSKHLSVLKEAGLVREEQRGKRTFYSLPEEYPSPRMRSIVQTVLEELRESHEPAEDRHLANFLREFRIETVEGALNARRKRNLLRML